MMKQDLLDRKRNNNKKRFWSKKLKEIFIGLKNIYFPFETHCHSNSWIFDLVKKRTNVSISGDGGDEIFFDTGI